MCYNDSCTVYYNNKNNLKYWPRKNGLKYEDINNNKINYIKRTR